MSFLNTVDEHQTLKLRERNATDEQLLPLRDATGRSFHADAVVNIWGGGKQNAVSQTADDAS